MKYKQLNKKTLRQHSKKKVDILMDELKQLTSKNVSIEELGLSDRQYFLIHIHYKED